MRKEKDTNYQHDEIFLALNELTQVCRNLETRAMDRDKKVDEMVRKVEEMYKVFNNGSFLVMVVKWAFGLLLAIGGAYLLIKQIFFGN